jgi:hypothetical protein
MDVHDTFVDAIAQRILTHIYIEAQGWILDFGPQADTLILMPAS